MASRVLEHEENSLTWTPVVSTNLREVAFVPDFGRLWVRFLNGGVYVYHRVPASVYEGLLSAGSKGGYHARHIKGQYGYEKVG